MSDAPQGNDWWQASDGKWYPPAGEGAPTASAPAGGGGGGGLSAVPVPKVSSGLLSIMAWAVLALGVISAFWNGFVAGPDDFVDKIGFFLSSLGGWAVPWAVLLVAAVLATRAES